MLELAESASCPDIKQTHLHQVPRLQVLPLTNHLLMSSQDSDACVVDLSVTAMPAQIV